MENVVITQWTIYGVILFTLIICEYRLPRMEFNQRWHQDIQHILLALVNRLCVVAALFIPLMFVIELEWGLLWWVDMPAPVQIGLGIVLLDGWQYIWHRLNHRIDFFWRFHQVHHADREMNYSTAFRFHPGEIALSMCVRLPVFLLLGLPLESLILYEALSLPVIWFHHANIVLPEKWDQRLRWFFVTPGMHEVHHSMKEREMNSNYASFFSGWDKLFGTYTHCAEKPLKLGLHYVDSWKSLKNILFMPFWACFSARREK